jgi:hypothetical protein
MSKKLGQAAARAVVKDFFGDRERGGFTLKPPLNFELFNSLRALSLDTFAGVTVALVDSVFWQQAGKRVSSVQVGDKWFYSGSHSGDFPVGVVSDEVEQWLVIASYFLNENDEHVKKSIQELAKFGCAMEAECHDQIFMFLRARDALAFNTSLVADAEQNVAHQAEEEGYESTPLTDVLPFYERFIVLRVGKDSPLFGRSVFWYSYLIAANWRGVAARHVNDAALSYLSAAYEANLWHFPIDNARLAIVASHFKHTFIDLYRCVEWLYDLPRCMLVKAELNLQQKATLLAKTLREKLAWRRTERDSLEQLLLAVEPEKLDPELVNACLLSPLHPLPPDGPLPQISPGETTANQPKTIEEWRQYAAKALAARIYAVRNQFVHQLDAADQEEISEGTEPAIVALLAQICSILYLKYAPEF